MRTLVLALVLLLSSAPGATAQSGDRWLILPTTSSPGHAWVEPTAARVRASLLERRVDAWSPGDATRQFESAGSAPPAEVTEAEVEQWIEQSNKAIRNLAEGDYNKALEQLRAAQKVSRNAVEELNREHKRAQRMLDTCLYTVRVLLETSVESRARSLVQECRQLVPRIEPTAFMHPPGVLELLREVDAFRATKPRTLEVGSEPAGCAVRINGVVLGKTPLEVDDLFPGDYRLQVECEPGRRGRVHPAGLTTASTSAFVDVRFDQVVVTQPILQLRYDDDEQEGRYRMADAAQVVRAVSARAVLFLSRPEADVLVLELARGEPLQPSAVARIATGPEGPGADDLSGAIRTLLDGECTDFTSGAPVSMPCPQPAPLSGSEVEGDRPDRRMPRRHFIAGLTLASVGSASLITGYLLLLPQARAANEWLAQIDAGSPDTSSEQARWINVNTGIIVTSSIGAATLVAAMPLVLPKRDKTPWAAWMAGGLGVGALAFSIGYGVAGEKPEGSCRSGINLNTRPPAEACITHAERVSASVLAGTTAAPLLTIPLVYLLRRSSKKIQPQVEAHRQGGYVGLSGEF